MSGPARLAVRLIVRLSARAVPPHLRDRWREEWLAEIDASAAAPARRAAGRRQSALRRVLGSPRDAWALRTETRRARRTAGLTPPGPGAGGWRHGLGSDVRHALRQLSVRPAHAAVTMASLAIGLAVSTTTFAILSAILFGDRPGVIDRHTISRVRIGQQLDGGVIRLLSSRRQYAVIAGAAPAGVDVIARGAKDLPIEIDGQTGVVQAVFVSSNYFSALGTIPRAGRVLTAADSRIDADAVVIDTKIWRERFGESPAAIGASITVAGRPMRVAGIAPDGFTGWSVQLEVDEGEPRPQIWVPLAASSAWSHLSDDQAIVLELAARRGPGMSEAQAAASLQPALPAFADAAPRRLDAARLSLALQPVTAGPEESLTEAMLSVLLAMIAPLAVLAIGCANAANLRLARATERTRDLAVRLSLGGSRWRVLRPLLIESVALVTGACAAGLLGARAILNLVEPALLRAPLDWRVATFVALTGAAVVLVAGLAPAWRVTGRLCAADLKPSPQAGGLAHGRLRAGLVVAQVALSVTLLGVGALSIRTVLAQHASIAGPVDEILVAEVDLGPAGGSQKEAAALAAAVIERLSADARTRVVAIGDRPLFGRATRVAVAGRPSEPSREVTFELASVTPAWARALDLPLIAGRWLTPADAGAATIVLAETLANSLGGPKVLGTAIDLQVMSMATGPAATAASRAEAFRAIVPVLVVGIVGDGPRRPGSRGAVRIAYAAWRDPTSPAFTAVVRADRPTDLIRDVRGAIASLAPRLPAIEVDTMASIVAREMTPWRYFATGFGALGGLALVLAASGLYAMLAYVVSLRTREIGVRMAIGARPADVHRLVLGQAARVVALGAAAGMAVTTPIAFGMRALFPGVSPIDPLAIGSMVALLSVVAGTAALIPARRAAGIDPVAALRAE